MTWALLGLTLFAGVAVVLAFLLVAVGAVRSGCFTVVEVVRGGWFSCRCEHDRTGSTLAPMTLEHPLWPLLTDSSTALVGDRGDCS